MSFLPVPGNGTGPTLAGADPVRGVAVGNLDDAQDTTAPRGKAKARDASRFAPTFRTLVVGHDPRWSPEASIVLAAVAARNGLTCEGADMEGRTGDSVTHDAGRAASLAWVARETGLCIDAVRRGALDLVEAGHAYRDPDTAGGSNAGLFAVPAALAARWAEPRRRLRFDQRVRSLGMRARPMLLAGLVLGQVVPSSGKVALGLDYLCERTGLPRRTLQSALAAAQKVGALHKWTAPVGGGQLCLAPGPSQSGARVGSQSGARVKAKGKGTAAVPRLESVEHRELAHPPSRTGVPTHREAAPPPSQSGARHPDCPSESQPDSPTDARLRVVPDGETKRLRPAAEAPAAPAVLGEVQVGATATSATAPHPNADPRAIVEQWVTAFALRGIEQMQPQHAADVAGLLDQLGSPDGIRDRRAVAVERLRFAVRVIAWCSSPTRLGEWLVCASQQFGVAEWGAYLRRTVDSGGDPGALLGSHMRNRVGRAAETWQHFTPETERQLEGERADDVARIVDATAQVLAAEGEAREFLRHELRKYLSEGRKVAARAVLLELVGSDRTDEALARAVGDVCTVEVARELLAA
ncbi:MAG: hypothetical protein JNL12_20800 [Planctomycetes bacterium]|nr:hypothetical protein [Planctomycetota bacterium]